MINLLSLYNFIPPNHKQFFVSKISSQVFKKGEFLLIDGEVQDKLYLVKKGITMMYYDTDEKPYIIDFAYFNKFTLDIHSFSEQTPSKFCIQCLQDCEVEWIEYNDLQETFDYSQDIERAYRLLTEKVLAAIVKKQLDHQILDINQRFIQVMQKRPELFKLIPHKYIASYIGINPTNFSKLYNQHCINNGLTFK